MTVFYMAGWMRKNGVRDFEPEEDEEEPDWYDKNTYEDEDDDDGDTFEDYKSRGFRDYDYEPEEEEEEESERDRHGPRRSSKDYDGHREEDLEDWELILDEPV